MTKKTNVLNKHHFTHINFVEQYKDSINFKTILPNHELLPALEKTYLQEIHFYHITEAHHRRNYSQISYNSSV